MSFARSGTVVSRVASIGWRGSTKRSVCRVCTYRERITSDQPTGCRIDAAVPADGLRRRVNRQRAES